MSGPREDPAGHDGWEEPLAGGPESADEQVPPDEPSGDGDAVDVDAAWADIVAHWGETPDVEDARRRADADRGVPDASDRGQTQGPAQAWAPTPAERGALHRGTGAQDAGPDDDEDHYTPPEPPPLPRGDLVSMLAWAGAVGGPALLLVCLVAWRSAPALLVAAAVLAFVAGFGVLVARLPRSRDDDEDDGAVV